MFSRLSLRGSQGLARCLSIKFQSSAASASVSTSKPSQPQAGSGQRDLINFPRRAMNLTTPPVRFVFIPDSWFKFFYPKTGATGPYMFMISVGTYLFSKEIIVIDHNFVHAVSLTLVCFIITRTLGDKISKFYNNKVEEYKEMLDAPQRQEIENCKETIQQLEKFKNLEEFTSEVAKARVENVLLEMEAAYRDRLEEAHSVVKSRLDCMVELENVERRAAQQNLTEYVLRNVMKSITPEIENNALQSCIQDLNSLSARV